MVRKSSSGYQRFQYYDIDNFRDGLNLKPTARLVKPSEAQVIQDADLGEIGLIKSKKDDETFCSLSDTVWMVRYKDGYLATTHNSLYRVDGNGHYSLVLSGFGGMMYAREYGDFIYLTNGVLFKKYDGNQITQCGVTEPSIAPTVSEVGITGIDYCDAAWTSSSATTVTIELDDSNKKQGGYGMKFSVTDSFTTGLLGYFNPTSSIDISDRRSVGLWIRSNTAIDDGQLKLVLGKTDNCATIYEMLSIPAIYQTETFEYKRIDMVSPRSITALESIGLYVATNVSGSFSVTIDAIEADSGPLEGQYQYYYSYVNQYGFESAMSPESTITRHLDRAQLAIYFKPSTDNQVSSINVYRTGGSIGSTKYLVGTVDNRTQDIYLYCVNASLAFVEGDYIRGATSLAGGTVVSGVGVITSGTYAGGDASVTLRLTGVTGTFKPNETIQNITAHDNTVATTRNTTTTIDEDPCSADLTIDWSVSTGGGTLAFDTDHYEWTNNLAGTWCYLRGLGLEANTYYRVSIEMKDGTATPTDLKLFLFDGVNYSYGDAINTDGSFTAYTADLLTTLATKGGYAGIYNTSSLGNANIEFKNVYVYKVSPTTTPTNNAIMLYDRTADEDLVTEAENEDNYAPRTIGMYLEECDGRFFMASGNTLYCSRPGAYREAWPLSYYVILPETITALHNLNEQLTIFTKNHSFKLIGTTPDDYEMEEYNWENVCLEHNAIAKYRNMLIGRGNDNVYLISGADVPVLMGEKVEELFVNTGVGSSMAIGNNKMHLTNNSKILIADLLHFPSGIIYYEYDLDINYLYYDRKGNIMFYCDSSGISKLATSTTDVAFDWRKNKIHFGLPSVYKYLRKIWISYTGALTMNVYVDDSSTTSYTVTADTTTSITKGEFSLPYTTLGHTFDIDLDVTGTIEPPITIICVPLELQ